ncbi:MAG: ATP-binding protein [Bacteroidia bacterium]|nr:ATP-binding protein [Bacteroidia bacterium]
MRKLFITGVPVTANDFVGRKQELKEIKYLLQNGQSVVLIAPRRFGKTSLALTVLAELQKKGFFTTSIDLFTITNKRRLAECIVEKTLENKKVKNFIKKIKTSISDIFKRIEFKQIVENYEFILKFSESDTNIDELLETSLDFPENFGKKEKKNICIFFDEFGDVAKFDGNALIKLMRGKFQLHENVSYLFAGSYESIMNELFAAKKSAFYKFCKIINLGEIASSDFTPYIKNKFKEDNFLIKDNAVKLILEKTKGHPYYTQLLCRSIHYLFKGEKNIIETSDVNIGYEEALISEKTYFEKLWEELKNTPAQLDILLRIASRQEKIYSNNNKINVTRSLKTLLTKGIIKKISKGSYSITDPFFDEYVKRNI